MNRSLRILFISRATLYKVKGGDTIQMLKTADELRKLGVEVDIFLSDNKHINYSDYELIHFFNLIRPADILPHLKSKLPYVISTIYVDYSDYENHAKSENWKASLLKKLPSGSREYLKVIARMIFNGERIHSFKYLIWGHLKSIKYILKHAALILPNSLNEYNRVVRDFGPVNNYKIINNAADSKVFNISPEQMSLKEPKMVLCVGRIEGRKNQLNLIKALNNTAYELYIIGDTAPNHMDFFEACKQIAAKNIHFISQLSQEELVNYYRKAAIHILPSWFETTGLSSLEALFCGCKVIVSANGDTSSYFDSDYCVYCEPCSIESIKQAVEKADKMGINWQYITACRSKYNWEKTAMDTLQAYNQALNLL